LVKKKKITFKDWSKKELLRFLALDAQVNVPVFGLNGIDGIKPVSSLTNRKIFKILNKKAVKLRKITETSSETKSYNPYRLNTEKLALSKDKKIHVSGITHVKDLRDMLALNHVKVYNNVNVSTLPKSPISSVFGQVDSIWTYVITNRGTLEVVLNTSGLDLFAKHGPLNLMDEKILIGGELKIDNDGTIRVNLKSGAFSKRYVRKGVSNKELCKIVTEIFKLHYKKVKIMIVDKSLIPKILPHSSEIDLICHSVNDRMYYDLKKKNGPLSEEEFEIVKKSKNNLCNYLSSYKDVNRRFS